MGASADMQARFVCAFAPCVPAASTLQTHTHMHKSRAAAKGTSRSRGTEVIGGVESALRQGCPRTTTGVSQHWFSGHFRQVFFNTIALPRINIGADVWGESSIMTGVYERWCSSTLHISWGLCDCLCLVLVCRGRYSLGGVVLLVTLLFILGLNFCRGY